MGIDTDNGAEFINVDVVAYCEREHLTFTCGRPEVKNDQCHIEQKNRAVVRSFVGHDRPEGSHTHQQLDELYRALRLYVNCFQPSMKLLSKTSQNDGRVCRVYDEAKTPLQRLLLSGVLSASAQHELEGIARALDPLELAEQVEQLQHAVFRCAAPSSPVLHFPVESCLSEALPNAKAETDAGDAVRRPSEEADTHLPFLNWQRSKNNPFASAGEHILTWVRTHPEQSTRDLFEELQQEFPGRYQPSQYPALQRAVRKMRAYLRSQASDQPWPLEIIHGSLDAARSVSMVSKAMQADLSTAVPPVLSASHSLTEAAEASCAPKKFVKHNFVQNTF